MPEISAGHHTKRTEERMAYHVTIDFKRGPSIGLNLIAEDRSQARSKAANEALGYGFDAPIKKVTIREA